MDPKGAFYKIATVAWMILVFGAWIYVDAGYAEPFLTSSTVPGGSTGAFVGALVAFIAGGMVIGTLKHRHEAEDWEEAGRQAGLEPTEDANRPELTGTVDGRTVTARYETRTVAGGEGGSQRVTVTFADVELAGPADEAVVVGTPGETVDVPNGVGTLRFDDLSETASAAGLVAEETEILVLLGTSSAVVEDVADGQSGRALQAIRDLEIVSAGDASGMVAEWAEARNEELEDFIAEFPVENLAECVPGDAATVTVETRAAMRDRDVLRRFTEGVVAIADAFEEASASTPGSG